MNPILYKYYKKIKPFSNELIKGLRKWGVSVYNNTKSISKFIKSSFQLLTTLKWWRGFKVLETMGKGISWIVAGCKFVFFRFLPIISILYELYRILDQDSSSFLSDLLNYKDRVIAYNVIQYILSSDSLREFLGESFGINPDKIKLSSNRIFTEVYEELIPAKYVLNPILRGELNEEEFIDYMDNRSYSFINLFGKDMICIVPFGERYNAITQESLYNLDRKKEWHWYWVPSDKNKSSNIFLKFLDIYSKINLKMFFNIGSKSIDELYSYLEFEFKMHYDYKDMKGIVYIENLNRLFRLPPGYFFDFSENTFKTLDDYQYINGGNIIPTVCYLFDDEYKKYLEDNEKESNDESKKEFLKTILMNKKNNVNDEIERLEEEKSIILDIIQDLESQKGVLEEDDKIIDDEIRLSSDKLNSINERLSVLRKEIEKVDDLIENETINEKNFKFYICSM